MRYIKPEIELNEVHAEDVITASGIWGEIVNSLPEGTTDKQVNLGSDESGNPQLNADASFFG